MTAAKSDRLSDEIRAGAERADVALRPHVRETPLRAASSLGRETGTSILMKLETLQTTGSFKIRGALTKLLSLSADERARGVVAASTGNHGIAVAEAGAILGVSVHVFVPDSATVSKLAMITERGADVRAVSGDPINAERDARRHAEEQGLSYVSPHNDASVIAAKRRSRESWRDSARRNPPPSSCRSEAAGWHRASRSAPKPSGRRHVWSHARRSTRPSWLVRSRRDGSSSCPLNRRCPTARPEAWKRAASRSTCADPGSTNS
jgi:hypothetical protein